MVWKMWLLLKVAIFGIYINFQGCNGVTISRCLSLFLLDEEPRFVFFFCVFRWMHCWFQSLCQVTVLVFEIGPFNKLVFFYFGLHRHRENLIIFRYINIYVPSLFLDSKSSCDINSKTLRGQSHHVLTCFDFKSLWRFVVVHFKRPKNNQWPKWNDRVA